METALSLSADDGPCSAKNMTFAQTALYIRRLELRWMDDQRRIRQLERQLKMITPLPPLKEKSPNSVGVGALLV
jgi:hypothetical protein